MLPNNISACGDISATAEIRFFSEILLTISPYVLFSARDEN
jgi:hypothetical protein